MRSHVSTEDSDLHPIYTINYDATILDALEQLNALSGNEVMTLIVIDVNSGKVIGTVTDGDIRRGLLNNAKLTDRIETVAFKNFFFIKGGSSPIEKLNAFRSARQKGLKLLPELNADATLHTIHNLKKVRTRLPLTALLMAGGKGERLRPLTLTTPKPLLKIGDRPIIEYNLENLARNGIEDVWVSVNYLASKLKEYFAQPRCGISAKCVEEPTFLGTIGSAKYINPPQDGETLVMNSDLLSTIDLEEMYLHHLHTGSEITVAAIPYTLSVPYALLRTDGTYITSIEEKPTYSHFANAGIYIFANHLLRSLPEGVRTDATDLIEQAINNGMKVSYFPINGTWIDIGSPADFRHAEELIKHHRGLSQVDNSN